MPYIQLHRQLLSRGPQISRRHLPSSFLPSCPLSPVSLSGLNKSHLRGCCRALSTSSSSSSSSSSLTQPISLRPSSTATRNRPTLSLTLQPPALHPTNHHQIPHQHQHRRPLASTTNIAVGTIRTKPIRLYTT